MAASAKMSYNFYQNGKHGTMPQTTSADMETTNDMHLKMSKKIAQLTKVIYALNTKNDEHEAIVQQIREQHESEIQQLLKETKDKLDVYKTKVNEEANQKKRVQQLESSLREYEGVKHRHLSQFEEFKKASDERETKLKAEHAQKMLELSHDVLGAKKDFEEKLRLFEIWKAGLNDEHDQKINQLKKEHEKEIENIRSRFKDQNNDWLNEVQKVGDKYKNDLEGLQQKYKELEESKVNMAEDYEAKLEKSRLFYEKELEAVMKQNNISQDEVNRLLIEEKENIKKDFAVQEAELKKQINSALSQLTEKEDEVDKLTKELHDLTKSLQDKEGASSEHLKQLQAAKDEAKGHLAKLKDTESELAVMKERCARQEDDLVKKSSTIGQLEATKLQNESTIQELQSLTNKLQDKLSWLEKERNNLERQKSDLNQSQTAQLKSLEKSLEDLSIEKQAMKERYEREIDSLRNMSNRSEKELLQQHEAELDKLRQQMQAQLATQKLEAEEKLDQVKQEMTKLRETEVALITEDRDNIKVELERLKSELTSRLKAAEDEVSRVNSLLQNKEQGLGSATGMINNLKDANSQLQQQLERAQADFKSEKSRASSLQAELDKLRLQHEAGMKQAKLEFQDKLQQVTKDLDNKWQDTVRRECNKLREEINAQKESEMRAALEQLARMKDDEIAATRAGWEKKVKDLMKQLDSMGASMQSENSKYQEEIDRLKQLAEEQRKQIEQEMLKSAEDYMNKIKIMEAMHEENVQKITRQKHGEMEEMKKNLQEKHIDDMQTQTAAHKASIEGIKDLAEKSKQADLHALRQQLDKENEELKSRLYEKQISEIEKLNKQHESHMQAARMELERAVEISRQKEKDHALRVEDLQGEITQRDRHIVNLKEDNGKLQQSINQLHKEIEFKLQEMQKIKADAENKMRHVEKRMVEKMQREKENLEADHLRESQELLHQFNEAQDMLKDKISELQIALDEAEERYDNRDSRPEDLELIEQLRYAVYEKGERIKALNEEKKYFQMELVNRETNFNKVFSASPNVGILNPLDTKKKNRAKGNNSAPNLSGRLDPLPGSPLHNSQLNPSKPLPPFPKKFVK